MTARIIIASAAGMIAFSAHAYHSYFLDVLDRSVELKDGSTVHIFKDGKMGMEDKYGRAFLMKEGTEMETKDGEKIIMKGNEVWRVDGMLFERQGGGS